MPYQAVFASPQPGGMASMSPPAMVLQQMHLVNRMEIKAASASGESSAGQQPVQKLQKKMHRVQQIMHKLHSASGSQFDRAYIMAMIKSHRGAVSMLRKVQAHKLNQPRVTGLVDRVLPILEQHLKLAEHLQHRAGA